MKKSKNIFYKIMHKKINYNYIIAQTLEGGIGKDGDLPCELPTDLKYFKNVTTKVNNIEKMKDKIFLNNLNLMPSVLNHLTTQIIKKKKDIDVNKKKIINCVIMGRVTYDSIPINFRPLKDRFNIILSKNKEFVNKINNENNSPDSMVIAFLEYDDVLNFVEEMSKKEKNEIKYYKNC